MRLVIRIPILTMTMQGLANGFPLSAVISRKELTDKLPAGSMGGTYAGNAVSCAAAVASADAMKEEKILENVDARCVPNPPRVCLSIKVPLPHFCASVGVTHDVRAASTRILNANSESILDPHPERWPSSVKPCNLSLR